MLVFTNQKRVKNFFQSCSTECHAIKLLQSQNPKADSGHKYILFIDFIQLSKFYDIFNKITRGTEKKFSRCLKLHMLAFYEQISFNVYTYI
jgi:hypothetical protein